MKNEPLVSVIDVSKSYVAGQTRVRALRDISFDVHAGEMLAITGRSGSGKSTMLNLLTGIDHPTSGVVRIDGTAPSQLRETQLAGWRGRNIGIVFQFFQLLPTLTVEENVALPMEFCGIGSRAERSKRAAELLDRVGIADQARKFPSALSGGQQQRAAIARALANDPPIIVADEPTGNLDSHTARNIFHLFQELAASGKTVIVVTHESEFAELFDRNIVLDDGVIAQTFSRAAATRTAVR